MSRTIVPENYFSRLSLYETQEAITIIKKTFEDALSKALHLKRVSAPLFVETASGLNDNLSGVERPVRFDIAQTNSYVEVVHSLAKWKRQALHQYSFPVGEGLYTDMNAIRRDEELDNLHSIYVDQWDWEKVITKEMRTMATLKDVMQRIVTAICITNADVEIPAAEQQPGAGGQVCHLPGIGRHVAQPFPQGAGNPLCAGKRHRLHFADWVQA